MSSSVICRNFVQNAWKKELCSNCFKSKDEHAERPKPKPITLISNDSTTSIMKKSNKVKKKRSVCFTKELSEVIGYGGEDWESDDENVEDSSESSEEELIVESEQEEHENELQRITKENTDFNMNNLKEKVTVKKPSQLMLGKPVVDSTGRKQTLLVSVTPFGEDICTTTKRFTKTLSHIPISKTIKEPIIEVKSSAVLTSYTKTNSDQQTLEEKSLLDEITETLENSKNPIQIMARKKSQKDIILSIVNNDSNKENIVNTIEKEETNNSNCKLQSNEKKNGLSRTPALKRDQEKPIVYQTSTAKIELLNTKNIKSGKDSLTPKKPSETIIKRSEDLKPTVLPARNSFIERNNNVVDELEKNRDNYETMSSKDLKQENVIFPQSRELAGEPDGRADPDTATEPPALPLTPPPLLEMQNSYLHHPTYDKPKIPSKPATVLIRKPALCINHVESKNLILSTFTNDSKSLEHKTKLVKQDSDGSDTNRACNKRRAPKPPEEPIYMRSPLITSQTDSPVIRKKDEKQKRERASSCSPKIRNSVEILPAHVPEPAPRKSISMSTDSLASTGDEKPKEKSRGRFSLKRFLRMGSNKDLVKMSTEIEKHDENSDLPPLPKPRLVIVHPLELNGSKIEVMAKPNRDQVDYQNVGPARTTESVKTDYEVCTPKAQKPPPPPRSLDDSHHKPNLPHPPKSAEILHKQKQYMNNYSMASNKKSETVYANIGEVRSAIVPNKPQRTASMREREAQQQKHDRKSFHNNYEVINVGENVYDYINSGRSSPDCYSSSNKKSPTLKTIRLNKRSESSIDITGEYFKFGNIPRSVSLTYCGSETESEIYSPYSFYGSESEVTEDDHDWNQNGRTHKLKCRKGRSIVHKNLEDNYGAVIVANHEALAQVLENIQQTTHIQPALRGLKSSNLRWSDFSIISATSPLVVGSRSFHQALWNTQHVSLVINTGPVPSSTLTLGSCGVVPITEFSDLIPAMFLHGSNEHNDKYIQATVAVLPWMQVNTMETYSEHLKTKGTQEDVWKEASFIMLQLVNALKILQAQGIEELSLSLNSFILSKDLDRENHQQRLCVLQGLGEELNKSESETHGTLCMCASKALTLIQPSPKITSLIQNLLTNERSVTLTQVKSILEFCLWGPSDVALGSTIRERELALQRWLDLQRATVLHGLVCARVQLTVYEECHLCFLVRSNSRMMCDASLLLESSNLKHALTNGHK